MSERELERMGTDVYGFERSAGAREALGRGTVENRPDRANKPNRQGAVVDDERCATCWHCQPGSPFKGYCAKWGISVSYSETCKMHKEASPRRKKEIAQMQTWFEDHGYVEVKR